MEHTQQATQDTSKNENEEVDYLVRSGQLFGIDGSPQMHEDLEDGKATYFHQSLVMYERILRQKLCRNRDDWMGLVVFATQDSDPDTENILTLIEFAQVTVEMLKQLLNIIDTKLNYFAENACDKQYPLPEVLLHSLRCFAPIKLKMPVRQVNLVTCLEDPPISNDDRHLTRVHAKSFHSLPIILKVVGFGDWDFDIFYKELEMLSTNNSISPKPTRPIDLEISVMKNFKNYSVMDLTMGSKENKISLKVSVQSFAMSPHTLRRILMSKATNEPLDRYMHLTKQDNLFMDDPFGEREDDMEDHPPHTLRKLHKVLDRQILMTLEEAKFGGRGQPKGIRILYFKKASGKPSVDHIHSSYFVGLSPEASDRDKELFALLFASFLENGDGAICEATLRQNGGTYFYRMWASEELQGLYMYRIPFREEVNTTIEALYPSYVFNRGEGSRVFQPEPEKQHVMEKVLKKLKVNYVPGIFPNPKRSKQIQYVLALALDENYDAETDFEDYTQPAVKAMEKALAKNGLWEEFREAFPIREDLDDAGIARKIIKYDLETAKRMARSTDLQKFTVPQLKAVLIALGKNVGGVKAALITRIEEARQSL